VNKQNCKKFKNMDITSIVNMQCSHIFIKSTVNLQLGKKYIMLLRFLSCLAWVEHGDKFLIVDCTVVHALQNIMCEGEELLDLIWQFIKLCNYIFLYNNVSRYSVNAVTRFLKYFPKEAEFIKRTCWLIPLLYVQNHKDNCTYRFLCAYTENVCRFQGETAETDIVRIPLLIITCIGTG
jgi:Kyakuja-Dileera-Zisupton transposase